MAAANDRREAAVAGHRGDEATARRLLHSEDPPVRATALGALARMSKLEAGDVRHALADEDPAVRRRAAEVAVNALPPVTEDLVAALADRDPLVVEAACWALGEIGEGVAVGALATVATDHRDPLCREAAVAALGAIGDPAGLPAILAGTQDKPAIRRRAVLALSPFEGPQVEAALQRALEDRDWQVRQAAEDLVSGPSEPDP